METLRIGPGVPAPRRGARQVAGDAVRGLAWGVAWGLGLGVGITAWTMLGSLW